MTAFITKKKSALVFLCALLSAAAAAVLLNYLLRGPKLGPHYDFLMNTRAPPPVARSLLLVDTEDIIEPGSAIQLILTLTEMDAAGLVIESPVLSFSSGREGEGEILYRFDEEFALLGRNIQNLFEAIRIGSVPPSESERYVTELVELANRGKERLTLALVQHDEAGMARMERAAAAFGKTFKAGDLRLPSPVDSPWYSRPRPDWDGRIRRIAPILPGGEEHVVYAALKECFKDRFKDSQIFAAQGTPAQTPSGAEETALIPLDINGAILFEWPGKGEAFQRLPLDFFRQYGEADLNLQRLLKEADSLGIYSKIPPENSPLYLSEYALAMREEFLADRAGGGSGEPETAEGGADWIRAREEYFSRLEEFLEGPSEAGLVRGYEELIASEDLGEEGLARIGALRDRLIAAFGKLRTAWEEFRDMRSFLRETLGSSFVILGPGQEFQSSPGGLPLLGSLFPERPVLSGPEASLVLANSLLTGRAIRPGESRLVLPAAFLAALPVILIMLRFGPWGGLAAGCVLSALVGAGFSWSFILLGLWIDPLIPLGASLAAVLTAFSLSLVIVSRGARRFRLAYGPYVNKSCLKRLVSAGRPAVSDRISVKAAVITIRETGLLAREDRVKPLAGAGVVKEFRETASQLIKKAGGVIVGCDGDMVQACFGSPLERIGAGPSQDPYAHHTRTPVARAVEFLAEIKAAPKTASWRFGVDAGECAFGYMPVSGYSAFGRPVVRSRILSGLASRYKTRTIISESVNGELRDIPVRKLNVLKKQGGGAGEAFYGLLLR
ncbi:MAG: hypothetical protein LBT87_04655 [Treponema sp.]|jgi:class 3 adenylate cyclase|nr:hypothetical protein [Treponema sp.]